MADDSKQVPGRKPSKDKGGFFARLNRALTEVGIEHFDDDKDWDERVKLPAWQTERLRARYEQSKHGGRLGKASAKDPGQNRGQRRDTD